MKKGIAAAGLLLCTSALAQQSPIDHTLAQCLNGASTTLAMVSCYDRASQAWDSEMNMQYGQLMKRLTGEPKIRCAVRSVSGWRIATAGSRQARLISTARRARWRRFRWRRSASIWCVIRRCCCAQ